MNRADLFALATPSQVGPALRQIVQKGPVTFSEDFLSDLQDAGLIDHRNRLTERGKDVLAKFKGE